MDNRAEGDLWEAGIAQYRELAKDRKSEEPNIKGSLWLVSGLRWSERMVEGEAVALLQSLLLACSLSRVCSSSLSSSSNSAGTPLLTTCLRACLARREVSACV